MEQITVRHNDGTVIDLSSAEYGRHVRTCRHEVENQATDIVVVEVDALAKTGFAVGDTLTAGGQTYRLNTLPRIVKDGTRADGLLAYRAEFESVKYDLRYITFILAEGGQSDTYTGTLADWLRLIVRNANRVKGTYAASSGSAFLVGVDYYAPYTHTQDVFFMSGKSYYVEQDGATGREIVQLQNTAYTVGSSVGVWEQQHGSSADYDVVRVMEESDVYIRMVPGVDYALGMAKKDGVYYTFSETWSVGVVPSFAYSKYVTKEYAGQTLLAVLQDICREYGVEYRIAETQSGIVLSAYDPQDFPVDLALRYGHGNGLYRIARNMTAGTDIITRMYVYGSTENLYPSYRYGRLCLPGKQKEESYIEGQQQAAQYGIKEGVVVYDGIRPERTGKVTAVLPDPLKLQDTTMDFDLNDTWAGTDSDYAEWLRMRGLEDTAESRTAFSAAAGDSKYLIAGTAAKIHFNSGALAGREYAIASYDDSTKTFTVVRDEDGLPDAGIAGGMFAAGDEYVLTDIYMPWSYIDSAEQRLAQLAGQDYAAHAEPLAVYEVALTRGWVQDNAHQAGDIVTAGDFINILDDDTDADDDIKIQSYTRNYLTEDEYEITLCNVRRETYWERWWRRERRTLSKGVRAEDSVRSADGAAVGTGMLRTVNGGADSVSFSGGRIATGWGMSDVAPATWTLKEAGSHAVLIVPRSSGKSSLQIVPEHSAAAVARTSGAVRIGTISERENGKRRTATVVGIRTNIIGNDVILTYGDTPISLDFKMSDVDDNLMSIGNQMEALLQQIGNVASSVIALATRMQQAEADIALLKSIVIRPVTGVEFDVTIEDIDIPGQYSYVAHAVPADTGEQYLLHYDIYATGASETQSGSKKYLSYDVDGVTVVCMFDTDTGLLDVPQFVSEYGILQDTLFVNAIIDVGEETEKFTDMQQTYLHVQGQ